MSKIDFEIADDLEFEDGDCCVIIRSNGSIGRVVMPEMNKDVIATKGYKKLLDVLEILKPGAKNDFNIFLPALQPRIIHGDIFPCCIWCTALVVFTSLK